MHPKLLVLSLIVVSVLLALLLDTYPLALEYRLLRPQFTLLVVIYWVFILPQGASMLALMALGIVQDLLMGSPLGQHALMLMPVAWLCLRSYRRVRHFSRWQEVLWVLVLVAIALLVGYWVQSLVGRRIDSIYLLLPALTSALIWPLLALLLDKWRGFYRISRQV
ncbi:MAG TPA: rod shape-determining protein MreD [Cellvibrionaceae bacterium]